MDNYKKILDEYNYSGYENPAGELKKILEHSQDATLKKLIQTEIDCLHFSIWEGKLQSMFSTTDKTGTVINEYPSTKDLDQEALQYVITRLNDTPNNRLKARYGQILWNSNVKNKGKYVQLSIDACIDLVKVGKSSDDHYYTDFINLLFTSLISKYRSDEVKAMILREVIESNTPYDSFVILTPKILSLKKHFSEKEILSASQKSEAIYKDANLLSLGIYERITENAIGLKNALRKSTKVWNNRLGKFYEQTIDLRKDDETGMMPLHFCEQAIHYYKVAGNKNKVQMLLKKLVHLKANLKLSTVEIKFKSKVLTQLYRYHKDVVTNMMKESPNTILEFLSKGANIFPDLKSLNEAVSKREKSFLDFAYAIKYDINKNSTNRKSGASDLSEELFEEYNWYVQIITRHFLQEVFTHGVHNQKITFKTVIDFLYKYSWIGKNITYKNSGGEPYPHNWLAMIAPAIMEFFFHWTAANYSKSKFQNYILSIDSLTLKFEGILRDFARVVGADTLVRSKGKIREAYIEDLLMDKKILKYFNEDDLLLFRYLFTSAGKNIRNNVAHAFYKFHHYKPELMFFILMAILRLSKYQVRVDKIVL